VKVDLGKIVEAVRTLRAMGIEPESFSCSMETAFEIENAAIPVSILQMMPTMPVATLDEIHPLTLCGIPLNRHT
jgi:hypothetical protein